MSFHIRHAREGDVPELTAIYNHYVRETPITFDVEEWTVERRMEWFGQFAETGRHQLLVAEDVGGTITGYAGTTYFRPKDAYITSCETTIYTRPGHAGQGLGTRLYEALFEALQGADVHRLLGGVTIPNDASIRLHEKCGFRTIGVFTEVGRKFDRYWDVQWLEKSING